uniref:Glutamyl-tRNA(Gln) amidotransferase subunit B, mitochondrial n=1 Tax=Trichuris muris TaxID=70415 RepID=A0A5S6QLX1_TRIMR
MLCNGTRSAIEHGAVSLRRSLCSVRKDIPWQAVVGLEIHAQISSKTKLFSSALCAYDAAPNTMVALLDYAAPGSMPVLNRRCVEAAVQTAIALNCTVAQVSTFDRKHYFYADQPAGYQITQHRQPIASNGNVEFYLYNYRDHPKPALKNCRILRLQLEQDTGKTLTDGMGNNVLIDLNRCGVGLMEIVTEHDIQSGLEASCLVKELQTILVAIGSCRCRMERGELRVDANVSVKRPDETELRIRTEVKNLNSLRYIRKAIDFEIARHIACYESGNAMVNETRSFDFRTGETVPMRDKEVRQDYRYLPEPNLPPLRLYDERNPPPGNMASDQCIFINKVRLGMPSLPQDQRKRWASHKLPEISLCQILISSQPKLRNYYAYCVDDCGLDPLGCAQVLLNDLPQALKRQRLDLKRCSLTSSDVCVLVTARLGGVISAENFRKVVRILQDGRDHRSADALIQDLNLTNITDMQVIEERCAAVLVAARKSVEDYRKGKTAAMKHLLKLAAEQLDQRADSATLQSVLERLINRS